MQPSPPAKSPAAPPDVLPYQRRQREKSVRSRIVGPAVALLLALLATAALALPSIGHGHGRTSMSSEFGYGLLGTFLRVRNEYTLTAPPTTTYEFHFLPFLWNLLALAAIWFGCGFYCRRVWRR